MRNALVVLLLLCSVAACHDHRRTASSQAPTVAILSPTPSSTLSVRWVDVVGVVQGDASGLQVQVNGCMAEVETTGQFACPIVLLDGSTTITAEAIRSGAVVASTSVEVENVVPAAARANYLPSGSTTVEVQAGPLVGAKLEVPAGAFAQATVLRIAEPDPEHVPPLPFGVTAISPPLVCEPLAIRADLPVRITIPVSGTTPPSEVRIYGLGDTRWEELATTQSPGAASVEILEEMHHSYIVGTLVPTSPGQLRLVTDPPGATIYLDGSNTRQLTPAILEGVAVGSHVVKLYIPGYNEVFASTSVGSSGGELRQDLVPTGGDVPGIVLGPGLVDGLTVSDSLLHVTGSVTLGGAPLTSGLAVIALNGSDVMVPISGAGTFDGFVSLLPGANTLSVRANAPDGSTGRSALLRIENEEGQFTILGSSGSLAQPITVQLTWDTNLTDVDLHVYDPEGHHAWYGALGGIPGGMLDHDDVNGYGPEIFTMDVPRPGTYQVRVHYYSSHGHGPTTAGVSIWVGTDNIFTGSMLLSGTGSWWNA